MKRTVASVGILFTICALVFNAYLFHGKLLFPTNMLAAFYPPWNTMTFPGWRLIPFKGLGHDNVLFFYPEKFLLRMGLAQKSIPLWNPYNFTGGQLFGDGQAAPMYPLTLLYLLLPLPEAFSIMVILIPMLTMLFTYGMLRHFNVSRLGSLFGAVAFAFSGFMAGWMEENPAVSQSAIWLPLSVWMADLLITRPKKKWFIAEALTVATMMAAGFLQISLYGLFFTAAYMVFRTKGSIRRLIPSILSILTGLLLIGPYLTTTWEAYKLSPRDFVPITEIHTIFLVAWSHIISLFNPDWLGNPGSYNYFNTGSYYDKTLFIGVIPLVFVLFALFSKKTTWEKFFWYTTGVTLLLGFSSPFSQWLFSQPIPILTSMLPSRIFYLTSFSLAVIAAGAFDLVRKNSWFEKFRLRVKPPVTLYLVIIIVLEVFLISVQTELGLPTYPAGAAAQAVRSFIAPGILVIPKLITVVIRNIGISVALTVTTFFLLLIGYKMKRTRTVIFFTLFVLTALSGWYFTNKALYVGERQFLYPEHPLLTQLRQIGGIDRIGYADELSRVHPDANVIYGYYTFEGLNPVFPYRFGQLVRSGMNGGRLTNDIPRISVFLDLKQAAVDATGSAGMNRLLSVLDVKYIVEHKESGWYARTYPSHTSAWEGTYFRIWKNPDTLPRAFIATSAVEEHDPQKILDTFYNPNTDLRSTAIVEGPITLTQQKTENSVAITSYRMNDISMETQASAAGILVLTDTWAPGWHARIDGKDAPVYRTDFNFRGVPVPAGNHRVFMYYWPQSFVFGLWLMGGGVILLITCVLYKWPTGEFRPAKK